MALALVALLLGVIAGLRSMTAPAAVSWGAHLGRLNLVGSPLAFLGNAYSPWILGVLAIGELIADQLPKTPSRKKPFPFGGRIVSGALCGAAIGFSGGPLLLGSLAAPVCGVLGAIGAVLGTLGGAEARRRLAASFGKDPPAAILEDVVAVGGAALLIVLC